MAIYAGPEIVNSNLVLNLDAGNSKSYAGSGTTWTDLSGNGNNGTLYNSPTYSNGVFSFNGTTQYMQANISTAALNGDPSFSIEMYVRRRLGTTIGPGTGFWGMGGQGQGNSVEGWTPTANLIHLDVYDSTRLEPANTYPENSFVHIIWTKNGAGMETTNCKCFVNGSEVSLTKTRAATRTNQFNTNTAGTGICIGRINGDANAYYAPIDVSIFRVYSVALSVNEARNMFEAGRGRFGI